MLKEEIARNMLGKGMNAELISEVTGLSPEAVSRLAQETEKSN